MIIFAQNVVSYKDATRPGADAHLTKMEPEVKSHVVTS